MTSKKKKLEKVTQPGVKFTRFKNMSIGSRISVFVIAFVVILSLLAPLIAPYSPSQTFANWVSPSGEHLFGTDHVGRDILSRLLYGGRYSIAIGLFAALGALLVGSIIGAIAAVSRKWVNEVIMRIMDVIMAVPGIAMAAVMVLVFSKRLDVDNVGGIVAVIVIAIGFVYTPQIARIVRANVMSAYGEDYVRAVIVSGARAPWIVTKHVVRNTAAPVLVFATVLVADAIILEASLTFIGSGLQPTMVPTWGNVLSEASSSGSILAGMWWTATFPGIMIMLTVLCLNILSEGITDAMVAAPASSQKVQAVSGERKEDRLLLDPRLAYAEQAESLQERINQLAVVERERTDRFAPVESGKVLLEVKNLSIKFPRHGDVNVVDGVSFSVRENETMGLVGESGCGKSITALTIMGLIDPKAQITGEILYHGRYVLKITQNEVHKMLVQ